MADCGVSDPWSPGDGSGLGVISGVGELLMGPQKHAELVEKWKPVYGYLENHENSGDWQFQSLCIGWCVANGMAISEAEDFYNTLIPLGLY